MARGLTVVLQVEPGQADELRAVLRDLPQGSESPLARVPGTHFARWVVIPLRDRKGRPLGPRANCLLFSAEFDHASAEDYLSELLPRIANEARRVFRHCRGYPGVMRSREWLLAHRVHPGFSEDAIPGVRVDEVRDALDRRERLRAFVLRARGLAPSELKEEWMREFAPERSPV